MVAEGLLVQCAMRQYKRDTDIRDASEIQTRDSCEAGETYIGFLKN
jgi:hypothetical protein